jgi:BolA protein
MTNAVNSTPPADTRSTQARIEAKLHARLSPVHLEVANESHYHSRPGTDTHFRIIVVSESFKNIKLSDRHKVIYQTLDEEMKGGIHALTMHTFTPEEWQARGQSAALSPNCRGGSKADRV